MANHLYPNKVTNNIWDNILKDVLTSHASGQAMMNFPVFKNASWSFNHDAAVLREMHNWGIAERMHKIHPSPAQDIGNFILEQQAQVTTARPVRMIIPASNLRDMSLLLRRCNLNKPRISPA